MKYKKKVALIFLFFLLSMLFLKVSAENYVITVTESLPLGVYKLSEADNLKIGDIVRFTPSKEKMEILYKRGYLPEMADTLLKVIAADYENKKIKIENGMLIVNDINYGKIYKKDSKGRTLPELSIKELTPGPDEYLLLSQHDRSYDGRYFGLIKKDKILNKANIKIYF